MEHLELAADDANRHCPHAQEEAIGPCVDESLTPATTTTTTPTTATPTATPTAGSYVFRIPPVMGGFLPSFGGVFQRWQIRGVAKNTKKYVKYGIKQRILPYSFATQRTCQPWVVPCFSEAILVK